MNVKIARIKKGLSQKQLSKLSGVGLTTLSKIEQGEIDNIIVHNLRKVAEALGMTMTELFFSDDDK